MSYKCPNCEAEISHLNVEQSGYQYGSYNIETQDSDFSDSEFDFDGDYYYKCPECNDEVDPNDLEECNEDNEDEEDEENSSKMVIEIKEPNIPNLFTKNDNECWKRDIAVCKKCGQGYEFQDEEKEAECSKCGQALSKKSLIKAS